MSRINGIVNLIKDSNYIYNNFLIKCIKRDSDIVYKENDVNVTISFNNNKINMKRVTSEYIINLIFDNNNCTIGYYYLNQYDKNIKLDIDTLKCIYDENEVYLEYLLSMENESVGHFTFSLKLEVR